MEKFLVIGNFACQQYCEDDLCASQWFVGTFDTITDCLEAVLKDLRQVGRDHYECIFDEDMFDTEEELKLTIEEKVAEYTEDHWVRKLDVLQTELNAFGHAEILSNDFCCEETDQRQITKYMVYKVSFDVSVNMKIR